MLKIWQKNSKTYGAIMALAGLFVDWTCESQPSNWAFSWGPMKRQVEKKESVKQRITDNHTCCSVLTEPPQY